MDDEWEAQMGRHSIAQNHCLSNPVSRTGTRSNGTGCPTGWKESLNGKNWELTTWFRVACWRKLAEACNEYLDKGQQVFVEAKPS
jgi:hypothetical protein